jgi:RyR domain
MTQLPDIELVSAEVHNAWMKSKKEQGFSSRKSEEEEELMVPYEQLSEKQKDLDRNTVKAVYAAIRKLSS